MPARQGRALVFPHPYHVNDFISAHTAIVAFEQAEVVDSAGSSAERNRTRTTVTHQHARGQGKLPAARAVLFYYQVQEPPLCPVADGGWYLR